MWLLSLLSESIETICIEHYLTIIYTVLKKKVSQRQGISCTSYLVLSEWGVDQDLLLGREAVLNISLPVMSVSEDLVCVCVCVCVCVGGCGGFSACMRI